jgi:hypothetical protein
VHAQYGEQEVQVSIATGQVLNGKLSAAKLQLVQKWLDANRREVAYLWREIVERRGQGGRND